MKMENLVNKLTSLFSNLDFSNSVDLGNNYISYTCKIHGEKKAKKYHLLNGHGCKQCSSSKPRKRKHKEIIINLVNNKEYITYEPPTLYNKISGIYKLIINNKFYIGSANNIYSRLKLHKFELLNNKHGNIYLQRSFNKYKVLQFEIIEHCSKEECIVREQYYIDTLKPTLNILQIAGSRLGAKISQESILKRNNTIKNKGGFHHSEASKKKIRLSQLGVKRTEEVKLKTTGENNPNSKFTNEDIKNILFLLKQGVMIKDVSEKYNCNRNTIARIKSNKTYKNR